MKQNPFDTLALEYESWFVENKALFQSELLAMKQVVPVDKNGVEIGIGSGIFAEQLGIRFGKNSFRVTQTIQTLEDPATMRIENPAEGFGKGSYVVIKGEKV